MQDGRKKGAARGEQKERTEGTSKILQEDERALKKDETLYLPADELLTRIGVDRTCRFVLRSRGGR